MPQHTQKGRTVKPSITWPAICLALAFSYAGQAYGGANISTGLGEMVFDSKGEALEKAGVGPAVFPHDTHEESIQCIECHDALFKPKRGENNVQMEGLMQGKFCGAPNCHRSEKVYEKAFPLFQCIKCHTKAVTAQ